MSKIIALVLISYRNIHTYWGDTVGMLLIYIFRVLVILTLYRSLYLTFGAGHPVFMGLSFETIAWPLIITQAIAVSRTRGLAREITSDLRSGKIGSELLLPIHYLVNKSITHLTTMLVSVGYFVPTGIVIGLLMLGVPQISLLTLASVALLILLGSIVSFMGYLFVASLGFFIEDAQAPGWIYSKFDVIFGGNILPIVFLPLWLQTIAFYTPWFHSGYSAALYMQHPSSTEFITIAGMGFAWAIGFALLSLLSFRIAQSRITSNGG
jgi:ABC-type uncharacterized transport system permease subunit